MEVEIKHFSEEYSAGARDLILSILAKEYPFDRPAYSDTDLEKIGQIYGGERDSFFIGEREGKVVGTVGIKEDDKDSALLRRLFVSALHRRKGIGTKLLDKALEFCSSRGYRKIIFRCTDRMRDAMRLCEKKGFKETEALDMGGFRIHKLMLTL